MRNIENILVALDLSDIDETLIEYASFLAEKLEVEKVYFVHNIKKYEISGLFEEHIRDINLDEVIGEELNDKVEERFKAKAEWEVLISEDPYTESLIKYIVDKYAIDLAILGNKNKSKGTGVVSAKLLRLLKCDILSVPRNFRPKIETIWAGTDFSHASRKAFRIAEILQENTTAALKAIHVYSVPVQFSPYVSQEKIAPKIEKHVKEKYQKFVKKLDYHNEIEPLIILGRESAVAQNIASRINTAGADLLIVTDKGANTFSTLIVGSVTEDLFNENLEVPLWIAK